MRLQTVPALQGALWVRQGIRTFFKRPFAFLAMTGVVLFGLLLVNLVPPLAFLVLPLAPAVTVAFMIAGRDVHEGRVPSLSVFLEPFRAERTRVVSLLWLGFIYAVATFAIMILGDLVSSGAPEVVLQTVPGAASAPDGAAGLSMAPGQALGLLVQLALAGILSIPFWHAPALVCWDGHGCAKAMFSSTLACWRNRGAFAVYGAVWVGYVVALSLILGFAVALTGQPKWLIVVSAPLSLVLPALFYPSLYFTFVDCFVPDAPARVADVP